MKKIVVLIGIIISINSYSQTYNLDSLEGKWTWIDNSGLNEFSITLVKKVYNIPIIFGGGNEDCLIGAYLYKKNGKILIDNRTELLKEANVIDFPIWIDAGLGLGVRDYLTTNGRGEYKYLSGQSKIMIVSESNPMQIRWIINDNSEQVVVVFDNEDPDQYIFPKGTALPTDIVLTKVESGVE